MQWLLKQMHRNEFYLKVINFTFSIDMFYSMCLTENYQNKPKSNSVLLQQNLMKVLSMGQKILNTLKR